MASKFLIIAPGVDVSPKKRTIHLFFAWKMRKMTVKGRAHGDRETLVFTIEPCMSGGFLLSIRYYGDGTTNVTGAGVWALSGRRIEKAKQIAEESANRLLHGAGVDWHERTP